MRKIQAIALLQAVKSNQTTATLTNLVEAIQSIGTQYLDIYVPLYRLSTNIWHAFVLVVALDGMTIDMDQARLTLAQRLSDCRNCEADWTNCSCPLGMFIPTSR